MQIQSAVGSGEEVPYMNNDTNDTIPANVRSPAVGQYSVQTGEGDPMRRYSGNATFSPHVQLLKAREHQLRSLDIEESRD